jgi:hypothetical protein
MRLLPERRDIQVPRGQALVEFAMVLPLIALLLVMAIDFGRVFFGWVALQNAARIAADFAAQHPDSWPANGPIEQQDQDRYQDQVLGDLLAINCTRVPAGNAPDPTFPSGTDTGDPAVVELHCTFPLITPLAQGILGGPVAVGARSEFPINRAVQLGLPPPVGPEPPAPSEEPEPPPVGCSAPVASFTWSPSPARKNQPTQFTDTSSIGTCTVTAWSWTFTSPNGTSSQQNPVHTFTWNGNANKTFDVTLTITTSGGVDSETLSVAARP